MFRRIFKRLFRVIIELGDMYRNIVEHASNIPCLGVARSLWARLST